MHIKNHYTCIRNSYDQIAFKKANVLFDHEIAMYKICRLSTNFDMLCSNLLISFNTLKFKLLELKKIYCVFIKGSMTLNEHSLI